MARSIATHIKRAYSNKNGLLQISFHKLLKRWIYTEAKVHDNLHSSHCSQKNNRPTQSFLPPTRDQIRTREKYATLHHVHPSTNNGEAWRTLSAKLVDACTLRQNHREFWTRRNLWMEGWWSHTGLLKKQYFLKIKLANQPLEELQLRWFAPLIVWSFEKIW